MTDIAKLSTTGATLVLALKQADFAPHEIAMALCAAQQDPRAALQVQIATLSDFRDNMPTTAVPS